MYKNVCLFGKFFFFVNFGTNFETHKSGVDPGRPRWKIDGTTPISLGLSWPPYLPLPFGSGEKAIYWTKYGVCTKASKNYPQNPPLKIRGPRPHSSLPCWDDLLHRYASQPEALGASIAGSVPEERSTPEAMG